MRMTQVMMTDDGTRAYSVNRDVAHNFTFVAMKVAERLETHDWTFLKEFCEHHKLSEDDLGAACQAFCLFMASATEHRGESMQACMRRCGYLDIKESAQMVFMAMLGSVMTGIFWTGVHEATISGIGPCMRMEELLERGELCAKRLQMPRWKRRLHKLLGRLEAIVAAARGKKYGETGEPIPQAQVTQQARQAVGRAAGGSSRNRQGDPQHQHDGGQAVPNGIEPPSSGGLAGGPDQGSPG